MSDRAAVAVAVLAAAVAGLAPPVPPAAALLFVAVWAVTRRPAALAIALLVLVGGRAHDSAAALAAPLPERVDGPAQLVSDPELGRFELRAVVRVDGRRYVAEVPTDRSHELRGLLTGEWVHLRGRPGSLDGAPAGWVRSAHLAGRLDVAEVVDAGHSPPWYRVANAVHRTLGAGAGPFGDRRSLYLGLVIGDDRGQSDLTRFRFEAAGLTHLLAVSGSNVAFLLAVAAPALRRLGRTGGVVAAAALLVVFVLVTRAEPSVLRAAVMAAVALVAVHTGRVAPALRVLAAAVVLLLIADPLLVHSLGFQLSVAATAGLMLLSRPVMERLPGPDALTAPIAVTVAAQLATAPVLLALGGAIPSAATLANLLAAPAAGAVMALGVTVGLLAGLAGETTAAVLQLPAVVLVRWIDGVATVASRSPLPVLDVGRLAICGLAAAAFVGRHHVPSATARGLAIVSLCLAALALRPAVPAVGPHAVVAGAELRVGECGGRVLVLDGAVDHRGLLRGLWVRGVRRLDVVAAPGGRRDVATASLVAEQVPVRRSVVVGERAPPGFEPLRGRRLTVGGVTVQARGSAGSAPTGASDPRCSVAR